MRFGKELKASMVQAWRNKYVRYAEIKAKLKELKKLYEEHNIALNNDKNLNNSNYEIKVGQETFAKLTHDSTIPNMGELLIKFEDEMDDESKKRKYGFNKVTSVMEPNLESKMPIFDVKLQDIKFKEKEIAVLLEQDMYKVSNFYAQQCRYFGEQHNALCVRVELLYELEAASVDCVDSDDEKSERNEKQIANIRKEKSYLRLLFRQIYNAIRMLEQYRKINEMAFYKITKKHDKNSGLWKDLREITMGLIGQCNFGNNYFTLFLQKRLEHLYAFHLKPDDQKPGEAIERLKHPPSNKQIQSESCIIGLCGGWSIAILLLSSVLVATLHGTFWSSWLVYRSWYIFRASMALSIYLWLWGCDLWVFQKYQFNHAFIFGADPTTLLRVPHVWNIAAIFSVTTMIFTILFVLAFMFDGVFNIEPEIFSVMGLGCWFLYTLIPFPWLKHTKSFLLKSFGKQLISPFSTVEFIDFFLADQWTSLFTLVVDLLFSFCYLCTLDFLLNGDEQSMQCDNVKTKAWLSLFKLLPYWIRFWQCIRRVFDTKKEKLESAKTYGHICNAGKYFFSIIVAVINAVHVYHQNNITQILAVIFGIIATVYAYSWDIYKDWGLLRLGANKQHIFLRKVLTYPVYSYYIAIYLNFVCRIAWAVSLFPASFGIDNVHMMHYLQFPLNVLEILRRCMWNLFRIENEHLNNCGEFRVVRDIPIVQDYAAVIKINIDNGHGSKMKMKQNEMKSDDHKIEMDDDNVNIIKVSTLSNDSVSEPDIDKINEMMPLTQHRTTTISDRQSVILETAQSASKGINANMNGRNVIIRRSESVKQVKKESKLKLKASNSAGAGGRGSNSNLSSNSSSSLLALSMSKNDKKGRYKSIKKRKKIRKKKRKLITKSVVSNEDKKMNKKHREISREEGEQSDSAGKVMESDEAESDVLPVSNKKNKKTFVRIRGRNKNYKSYKNCRHSPTYSEDSELSESDETDENINSFTHKTWPRNIQKQKYQFSDNKMKKKRINTTNETEVIFKQKLETAELSNLTEENIEKLTKNESDSDSLSANASSLSSWNETMSRRKSRNSKDGNEYNVSFKLKNESKKKRKIKKKPMKKKKKRRKKKFKDNDESEEHDGDHAMDGDEENENVKCKKTVNRKLKSRKRLLSDSSSKKSKFVEINNIDNE